jgi:hypothetical protein
VPTAAHGGERRQPRERGGARTALDYGRPMTDEPLSTAPSRRAELRASAALAALGAWTVVVPYLGRAIGLGVDVASGVEVVDHVLPGALVAAIGGRLATLARRGPLTGRTSALVGAGISFLCGWWVLATHVPLVADTARGDESWGAAIWHASTSLPVVLISLWLVLRLATTPEPGA